ncbi:MAG: hypothetical protein EBR09_15235, partial [Proteobacteria bacterium]|nr:hypothetical protein [Pseudomonadota bacterium]
APRGARAAQRSLRVLVRDHAPELEGGLAELAVDVDVGLPRRTRDAQGGATACLFAHGGLALAVDGDAEPLGALRVEGAVEGRVERAALDLGGRVHARDGAVVGLEREAVVDEHLHGRAHEGAKVLARLDLEDQGAQADALEAARGERRNWDALGRAGGAHGAPLAWIALFEPPLVRETRHDLGKLVE